MRYVTRRSPHNAHLFAVAAAIGLAVWFSAVAPALASQDPGHECDGLKDCVAEHKGTFPIGALGTVDWSYFCRIPGYPYASLNFSYVQFDDSGPRKSVSAIPAVFFAERNEVKILMTNWWSYVNVTVTIACTKTDQVFGNGCGDPVGDPHCPIVEGSTHNYCGQLGFCFQSYEQLCQPSNERYRCTADAGIVWCQKCPG
jgi:hypothetical protein